MSVIEYKYQPATHEQLLKCRRWCQNQFQLKDWTVELFTGTAIPDKFMGDEGVLSCYGKGWINTSGLTAVIWVNSELHKKDGHNLYATTIHEMVHVMQLDRGDEAPELVTRIIEPMLYRLYCYEHKIKIMAEK
jgi:hypothetical protein